MTSTLTTDEQAQAQAAKLLAVADRHEAALAKAWRGAMADLQARFPIDEVEQLISSRRILTLPNEVNEWFTMPTWKADAALAGDDLQGQFLRTMVEAAKVAGVEGSSFTVVNRHAVAAARAMAADLISRERKVTQQAVRRVIVRAMRGNLTGREAAQLISRTIGLDARSAQALANFTAQLQLVDQGQLPAGVLQRAGIKAPKTARGRASAVDRYAKRLLRTRSETIARTEIMSAANRGLTLSWEQAARDGLIDRQIARIQWVTTWDDRTCPICSPLDGAVISMGSQFTSDVQGISMETLEPMPKITMLHPPAHQRCRCTTILLV